MGGWSGAGGMAVGVADCAESVAAKSKAGSSSGMADVGRAPMRGSSFKVSTLCAHTTFRE